jgi:AcrR family transcriptional regulator
VRDDKHEREKSERILNAVRKILSKEGFGGATIQQIASSAGVSRGLLHYYFKNKDEMMARAVTASSEVSLQAVDNAFHDKQTAAELAEGFSANLLAIAKGDRDFINLLIESWAVSRRSEIVGTAVRSNYQLFRESVKQELKKACADKKISPAVSVDALAAILIGLFDGLGLQLVMEPELLSRQDLMKTVSKVVLTLLDPGS